MTSSTEVQSRPTVVRALSQRTLPMHHEYRYVTFTNSDIHHLLLHVRGQMTKKTPCGREVYAERDRRYDEPPQDTRLCEKCSSAINRTRP